MEIILASGSPRRKEILTNVGIPFTVCCTNADEETSETDPREAALCAAERKARAAGESDALIIAADTVVAIEGQILGKPQDDADARRMLSLLSGKTHTVYTAVALRYRGKEVRFCEETAVTFRALSKRQIDDYITTGEPRDKAGAYGIQGRGALLVKKIDGDYQNVVGLPIATLCEVLEREFSYRIPSGTDKEILR